jgi:hypothetical protein
MSEHEAVRIMTHTEEPTKDFINNPIFSDKVYDAVKRAAKDRTSSVVYDDGEMYIINPIITKFGIAAELVMITGYQTFRFEK